MFDKILQPSASPVMNTQKQKKANRRELEAELDPYSKLVRELNKLQSVVKKVNQLEVKLSTPSTVNNNNTYTMSKTGKKALASMITQRNAPANKGARVTAANKPRMVSSARGVVIQHKEMIGSLISSGTTLAFSATGFAVNPGKPSGFPWLSTIASNFDKYRMKKLVVHLVSSQPTSVAGRIGVGIDYDSTDSLPGDRVDFFNLTHHAECAAWDSVRLVIPVIPDIKFVNSHTITDSKLIDMGQIVVMSDQIVATSATIADIIVEYHVELLEPQQAPLYTGVYYGANPAAFSALSVTGPNVGSIISTTSTTVAEWSLPQGCYQVAIAIFDSGSGSPVVAAAVHGGTGRHSTVSSTSQTNIIAVFKVTANDGTFRATFSGVTIANLEDVVVMFSRIAPTLFTPLAGATGMLPSGLTTY